MTSPILAGVGIFGSILGAKTQADAARAQAAAQSQQYQYQAAVAQLNKQIALQNQDFAVAQGEQEAVQYGMKARARAGEIRAGQAASGIDVGSGSAIDVRKGQQAVTSMDESTIRKNAARVAYGYVEQATVDTAQSAMYSAASANALAAGDIAANASLLSGATSVATKWLDASRMGIPGFSLG